MGTKTQGCSSFLRVYKLLRYLCLKRFRPWNFFLIFCTRTATPPPLFQSEPATPFHLLQKLFHLVSYLPQPFPPCADRVERTAKHSGQFAVRLGAGHYAIILGGGVRAPLATCTCPQLVVPPLLRPARPFTVFARFGHFSLSIYQCNAKKLRHVGQR